MLCTVLWIIFSYGVISLLINSFYAETVFRKCLCDFLNVVVAVRLTCYCQDYLFEEILDEVRIVVQLYDVCVLLGKYLGDLEKLSRFIRQWYGEAEDAAAGNEGLEL